MLEWIKEVKCKPRGCISTRDELRTNNAIGNVKGPMQVENSAKISGKTGYRTAANPLDLRLTAVFLKAAA